MATVNKDFKIKSGLIVEGTTGTINGYDILTKNPADDQHIIDLIGGETLVKSVESTQLEVDVNGKLSVKNEVFDAYGSADTAESNANTYTNNQLYPQGAQAFDTYGSAATAQANAESYAINAIGNAAGAYLDWDGQSQLNVNTNDIAQALSQTFDSYGSANQAELNANSYADGLAINYDAAGSAAQALSDAEDYTDTTLSNSLAANGSIFSAIQTAKSEATDYADTAIANLVDSAPATLDTLNELAAAIADNPNYATDVANLVAGKQDTLTAGNGIDIDGSSNITVDPYDLVGSAGDANYIELGVKNGDIAIDKTFLTQYTDTLYDAIGSADDVQDNLDTHTNASSGVHGVTGDVVGTSDQQTLTNKTIDASSNTLSNIANSSLTNSSITVNGYATALGDTVTLDTDDVSEGTTNRYFTAYRAKLEAANLLVNATQNNIVITKDINDELTITAENGVADSDTDDLVEGTANLYFTDQRAIDAIQDTTPNFTAVELNSVAKNVAGTTVVPVAGIATAYSWAKADYRSAEFLVKVAYGTHTEISKVLLTLDTSDNIAITEYGIVGTNGSASSVSATISGNDVQLQVTTANNTSTVTVVGTLLA